MKKFLSSGLAIGAMISLVGCGGGSSSSSSTPETVTGNLFNTYVEGATYECSSGKTGTTDNMGTYTCNAGDTVEFFIGAYSLGSTDAASGILDTDLLNATDAADIDILQLLQGIDDESDGVITIPEDFTALDEVTAAPGDDDFEEQVEATSVTLEDETVAVNNHAENLLQAYLGGKTLYGPEEGSVEKYIFDTNLTELNVTEIGTDNSESFETELRDGALYIQGYGHLDFVEATDDYLLLDHTNDGTTEMKLYFDEGKAKTVSEGFTLITEEKLSGKTFYQDEFDEEYQEEIYAMMTLSAGVVTRTEVINGGTPDTFTVPYEIINGKVRIDVPAMDEDPATYIWWSLIEETEDTWDIFDEEDQNQDGSIEWSDDYGLYLSKPEGYPDFTATSTTPDATEVALLRTMLAGNTWASADTTITFNADVTSIEFADGGTDTVSLDGMTLTHSEGMEVITIVNETTLSFSYNGVEAGETFTLVPAPDAADVALLREMLAGNTWESIDTTLTFNAEVTSVSILDAGSSVPFSDTVSLDGMTLTHSEGTEVITIVDETTLRFNTETFILVPLP